MIDFIPAFPVFLLIFTRVASFFVMMPLFSYRTIPAVFKLGLGFFLALLMVHTIEAPILKSIICVFIDPQGSACGASLGFAAY